MNLRIVFPRKVSVDDEFPDIPFISSLDCLIEQIFVVGVIRVTSHRFTVSIVESRRVVIFEVGRNRFVIVCSEMVEGFRRE